MITVDIYDEADTPILLEHDGHKVPLSIAETADLLGELVAALSLKVADPVKGRRPGHPPVRWKMQGRGSSDYAAALQDGRVLRVRLVTEDRLSGWIGEINGERLVPMAERKMDVQRALIRAAYPE